MATTAVSERTALNGQSMDGPATWVKITLRLMMESKINVGLTIVLWSLVTTQRNFLISLECREEVDLAWVTRSNQTAGLEGICLNRLHDETAASGVLWRSDWWRVMLVLINLLVNQGALVSILVYEWRRGSAWRSSDLAICFHLNQGYNTRFAWWLRIYNVAVTAILALNTLITVAWYIFYAPANEAMREDALAEACGPDALSVVVNLSVAIMAAWNLHAPAYAFAEMSWKGYEAATRYREAFRFAHFLKSAPTLLSDQLCTSAMRQAAALRGARSEKAVLGA